MSKPNSSALGAGFLVLSWLIFSLQDIAVRWMGGDYSVLQIVLLRSLVALPATLLFFRREGGRGLPRTQQHRLQYLRGFFLFLSFTAYMMGVAALPISVMWGFLLWQEVPTAATLLSGLYLLYHD